MESAKIVGASGLCMIGAGIGSGYPLCFLLTVVGVAHVTVAAISGWPVMGYIGGILAITSGIGSPIATRMIGTMILHGEPGNAHSYGIRVYLALAAVAVSSAIYASVRTPKMNYSPAPGDWFALAVFLCIAAYFWGADIVRLLGV